MKVNDCYHSTVMHLLTENILAEQDDVIQTCFIEHFASFLITIVTVLLLVKHRHFGTNNIESTKNI